MPTVAQSLAQTGFARTMSISLKSKMEIISNAAFAGGRDKTHGPGYPIESNTARITRYVASNLWVHSQKSLLRDPTPPILACIGSPSEEVYSDSEDMLVGKDIEWNEGLYAVHDEDISLSNSSESTDGGCLLPLIPQIVTSDNHQVQTQHETFTKPITNYGITELEEELLFDPLSY